MSSHPSAPSRSYCAISGVFYTSGGRLWLGAGQAINIWQPGFQISQRVIRLRRLQVRRQIPGALQSGDGVGEVADVPLPRMRIALLGTRGIPANYGGFETFAEEISVRLAERGHELTVYCRQRSRERTYRGVRLRYLP